MRPDQLIDEPQGFGLVSPEHPPGEHDRQGMEATDLAGGAGAAAKAGIDAQLDLRVSQARTLVVPGNPVIETQRQFQASSEAVTLDDHCGREGQGLDPVEQGMCFADERFGFGDALHLVEFTHVGAQNERTGFPRLEDQSPGRALLKSRDDLFKLCKHVPGQAVGGLAFAVNGQPADAVEIGIEAPVAVIGVAHYRAPYGKVW